MVYLLNARLRPLNNDRTWLKDEFLGYAALGNRPLEAALDLNGLFGIPYDRKVNCLRIFPDYGDAVCIHIVGELKFISPRHIVGLGDIADVYDCFYVA